MTNASAGPLVPRITADERAAILDFYARQMHLLDSLHVEQYAATFTEDGIIDHAHRAERVQGRREMLDGIRAALPRYQGVVVRHWFDHLLIDATVEGWRVTYYSMVTRTDSAGTVAFEPTFVVTDHLVRTAEGGILTRSRVIHQDRPAA